MCNKDQTQRFLFEKTGIRGQLVGLQESYQRALDRHNYPPPIKRLVGEFMAAALLLSTTIKTAGTLSIQAHGDGNLRLIMAECRNKREVRAIARWQDEPIKDGLPDLLGNARLAITIEPDQGQRYQGIVPLTGHRLSDCLEAYFEQSEQLKTRVWLHTEPEQQAAGILLQTLPSKESSPVAHQDTLQAWKRVCIMADTLTGQELSQLDNETILRRVFHEETVCVFNPSAVVFKCSCDKNRLLDAILTLGKAEVENILATQKILEAKCEFCNASYCFSRAQIEPYLLEQEIRELANDLSPSRTLH